MFDIRVELCFMNAIFTLNLVKKETLQQWQSICGSGSATHASAHMLHYELFALQKGFKIVSGLEIKVLYNGNKIILFPIKSKQKI